VAGTLIIRPDTHAIGSVEFRANEVPRSAVPQSD